jgi:hypothetical protein
MRTAIEILRWSFSADDQSPLYGAAPNITANLWGQDGDSQRILPEGCNRDPYCWVYHRGTLSLEQLRQ